MTKTHLEEAKDQQAEIATTPAASMPHEQEQSVAQSHVNGARARHTAAIREHANAEAALAKMQRLAAFVTVANGATEQEVEESGQLIQGAAAVVESSRVAVEKALVAIGHAESMLAIEEPLAAIADRTLAWLDDATRKAAPKTLTLADVLDANTKASDLRAKAAAWISIAETLIPLLDGVAVTLEQASAIKLSLDSDKSQYKVTALRSVSSTSTGNGIGNGKGHVKQWGIVASHEVVANAAALAKDLGVDVGSGNAKRVLMSKFPGVYGYFD